MTKRLISNILEHTHYHFSWKETLEQGLEQMSADYLKRLHESTDWLPGLANLFNAFNLPLHSVRYILLGESPYPRIESANGYAFWDQAVDDLWSTTGFSKALNRATSLRNFMKMLLVADNKLETEKMKQEDIAIIDKSCLIKTNSDLFQRLLSHGFLLLNTSLTLESQVPVSVTARYWQPFLRIIFAALSQERPTLLLFGNIAKESANTQDLTCFPTITAPHPYNLSFILNQDVIKLFKPLRLLSKETEPS